MADDSVSVYFPKELRARLGELKVLYGVTSNAEAIRRAVKEVLASNEFKKLHPPPSLPPPRVIQVKSGLSFTQGDTSDTPRARDFAAEAEERWKDKIPTHCSIHRDVKLYLDGENRLCWKCCGRRGPFED